MNRETRGGGGKGLLKFFDKRALSVSLGWLCLMIILLTKEVTTERTLKSCHPKLSIPLDKLLLVLRSKHATISSRTTE